MRGARRFVSAWWLAAVAASSSGVPGCGPDEGSSPECEDATAARPPFRLVLTAAGGPLPADTVLAVKYSGGEEEYRLADPPSSPGVVFCRRALRDGGAAQEPDASGDGGATAVEALSCKLWTTAAADVRVTATGYEEYGETLEAETDRRCNTIVTKRVDVELARAEGGA